jgi:hypothetical protein
MAVAGRRTSGTVARPGQIQRPTNSFSHDACCGMGRLGSAAYRFGANSHRGISNASAGKAGISGKDRRRALASASARPRVPERRPGTGRTEGDPIGSVASAVCAARPNCVAIGPNCVATSRDASGETARSPHILAHHQKNPRITRSQGAANPGPRSAHAADDIAWWWLLIQQSGGSGRRQGPSRGSTSSKFVQDSS